MLLVGLCYSSGNAEPGMAIPSRKVAQQRVDNDGAGFLRAGARAVFSDGFGDSSHVLDGLFRSNRSMRSIFWSGWRATGVDASTFRSERVGGMTGILDPRLTAITTTPSSVMWTSVLPTGEASPSRVMRVPLVTTRDAATAMKAPAIPLASRRRIGAAPRAMCTFATDPASATARSAAFSEGRRSWCSRHGSTTDRPTGCESVYRPDRKVGSGASG